MADASEARHGRNNIAIDFSELEMPEFAEIPSHPDVVTDPYEMDLPDGCAEIVDYVRTDALKFLANDPNLRGVGLGIKRMSGKKQDVFCAQFIAYEKLPRKELSADRLLPAEVEWKGRRFPVDVVAFEGDIISTQLACPPFTGEPSACSGAAIANDLLAACGGTFGGTWDALFGSGLRGLTCAHVALGFGIEEFLNTLPGSVLRLFESPSGEEIFTSAQVGVVSFRLMRIDTNWPMLVPWPFAIPVAGGLAFIFVDCAAGDVNPQAAPVNPLFLPPAPPGPPPQSRTIFGARIGSARPPVPGTRVYKIGDATSITWGEVKIAFLQLPIGIGPFTVIFDQILCDLDIATGDSGASLLMENGHHYLGSCWGGLGLPRTIEHNRPNCGDALLLNHALATPSWWISLLMDINFS